MLLIDIGWPGTAGKMAATLRRYDLTLKDIPYAIATHFHMDHAGLVNEAAAEGVKILLLDTQRAALAGAAKISGNRNHYVSLPDRNVVDLTAASRRATLAKIGIAGAIVSTPGHSDDSVSIVLDDGTAFTGDLHPVDCSTDQQRARTAESWNRITALGAHTVYPAHGPIRSV